MADESTLIENAKQNARDAIRGIMPASEKAVRSYVSAVAEAVVSSADEAVAAIYPGKSLKSLGLDAEMIDSDLESLRKLAGTTEQESAFYAVVYRLWSPRDDARAAAIELFGAWFSKDEPRLRQTASSWLTRAVEQIPEPKDHISRLCREFLKSTQQQEGMGKSVLLKNIGRAGSDTVGGLVVGDTNTVSSGRNQVAWLDNLASKMSDFQLFDDTGNFIDIDCDHIHLVGISDLLGNVMIQAFLTSARQSLRDEFIRIAPDPGIMSPSRRLLISRPRVVIEGLSSAILVGIAGFLCHHANPHGLAGSPMVVIPAALLMPCLVAALRYLDFVAKWHIERREDVFNRLTSEVENRIQSVLEASWNSAVEKLNRTQAREVVGTLTLVKKRPLDFALEGQLSMQEQNIPQTRGLDKATYDQLTKGIVDQFVSPIQPNSAASNPGQPLLPAIAEKASNAVMGVGVVAGAIAGTAGGGPVGCIIGAILGGVVGLLIGSLLIYGVILAITTGIGIVLANSITPEAFGLGGCIGFVAGIGVIIAALRTRTGGIQAFTAVALAGVIALGCILSRSERSQNIATTTVSTDSGPTSTAPPPAEPDTSVADNSAGPSPSTRQAPSEALDAYAPSGSGLTDEPVSRETLEGRTVSDADMDGHSLRALSISCNTIYAVHGYVFKRQGLQDYFDGQSWYQRNPAFTESALSALERQNIAAIRTYEYEKFGFGTRPATASSPSSTVNTMDAYAPQGSGLSDDPLPPDAVTQSTLSQSDLANLSLRALSLCYTEIYAAHGCHFSRQDVQAYYDQQPWYHPDPAFSVNSLSSVEKANLTIIRQCEHTRFRY